MVVTAGVSKKSAYHFLGIHTPFNLSTSDPVNCEVCSRIESILRRHIFGPSSEGVPVLEPKLLATVLCLLIMKSIDTKRSVVQGDDDHTTNQTRVKSHGWVGGSSINKSNGDQLSMAGYQERAVPLRRPRNQRVLRHRYQEHLDQPSLHTVAKAKMMSRFTRIQVLSIIKLATMDKLRETGTGGPNDPTAQQRLSTEGGGGGAAAAASGDGSSDEYHHQFYNTGRIGRRNALPDILGTHCTTTTADLSTQLGALSTSECTGKASDASSNSIAAGNNGQPPPTTTAT